MTDAERHQRAQEMFSDTYFRFFTNNWPVITSLREFRDAALERATEQLAEKHASLVNLFRTDPDFSRILTNPERPVSEETLQMIQIYMTEAVISSAHTAIDASSLVMAQSILDDCAWSYLKTCAMIAPEDWRDQIDAKKIELKTIREREYEDLRDELIQMRLEQIERESLLKKIDLLFALCHPPAEYAPLNNYTYDRDRLEHIDNARHTIIHENGFTMPLPTIEGDLDFAHKTAWFIMGLVHQKYGLQIDPARFLSQITVRG